MLVKLQNISKYFGADNILENISFDINENDKIGLIGVNGIGKSTLLNIITGDLYYDSGEIIKKSNLSIGYLKQVNQLNENNTINEELKEIFSDIYELKDKLNILQNEMIKYSDDTDRLDKVIKKYESINQLFEAKNGYDIEYKINNILNGLGFKGYNLEQKVTNLSGGEKVRLSLVKILLKEPELLILDEPTNHLDFDMLLWLENYIISYKGALIVVSHDRYFLDKICNKIYEIENHNLYKYNGNYSNFLIQKNEKIKRQELEYEKQQERIKKLNEFVNKNLARSASVNGVGTRIKELEKMDIIQKPVYNKSIRLKFEYDKEPFKDILKVKNLKIILNNEKSNRKVLQQNITFNILKGEKVAIIGKNGVGKTTLLKALQNLVEYNGSVKWNENVNIAYFDQEIQSINWENTVLEEIQFRFPNKTELEIRKICANLLITDDMVFKKIKELSGANKAKVLFCIMILKKANVLIFDEPTNHLDYIAKEELNKALKEYSGTIIIVSHDRYLLNNIANKVIEILPDKINVYNGNYDYYLNNKIEVEKAKEKEISSTREKNIILQNEKKKLSSLERKIQKLESEIEILQSHLNSEEISSDYLELSKINLKLDEKKENLEILLQKWLEINENIEKVNIQ